MNELITIISLWLKKRWSLIYKYRIAFPSSKNLFSQVWLKLAQPRYLTVLLISPLGKHLNKLNPLFTLGCLIWSKFDWNWHSGSGEGFWIPYYSLLLLFHYIANISPWKKKCDPSFEQSHLPKDAEFRRSLLYIGTVVKGEKTKMWKVDDDKTINVHILINFSFRLGWATNKIGSSSRLCEICNLKQNMD